MRTARAIGAGLLLMLGLTACGGSPYADDGPYRIAGGGTGGVYYDYGGRLADALQQGLGIDIAVVETHGSVDNLLRVGSGDALLGFAQGDTAADAIAGTGAFDAPLPVQAVARVYDEYVHVVVPADSEAEGIRDLAGLRISLGAENSGVQVIAARVLGSSGVLLDGVENPALGLDASIEALRNGEIDGFFWVGGLPTPGIEGLAAAMPIRLLPVEAEAVDLANAGHAGVYRLAEFPIGIYGIGTPTATMTVPNYLVAATAAPDELILEVTRTLFESRAAIARQVAAAGSLDRRQAIFTGPMPLHPGAAEYYVAVRH
ncbi:TAXI family TRAP transporter solute-binding subunit [Leucobacter soli]|uniref:TAXI family TRAP transporter solute-binding subunit n=1 Tax=Leucobacter soli TaxID=2812850 RepID=A0A916JZ52_9MICO|nr:TAXI family TRAP transporter solute-binding subunit [Leucobacter soli]CAG7613846.1 hypothetical protein LEUCIP111803_01733 [Leucobacter soli]